MSIGLFVFSVWSIENQSISIGLFMLSVWPIENQSMSIGLFVFSVLYIVKPVHINRPSVLCFLSGLLSYGEAEKQPIDN